MVQHVRTAPLPVNTPFIPEVYGFEEYAAYSIEPLAPVAGTGGDHNPSHVTVTGGGALPSMTGAPTLNAALGDGTTDATAAIQAAIYSAAVAGKPLLIPATSSFYRVTAPLTVSTSLIGVGGQPTIKTTSTAGDYQGVVLRLAQNFTGWIYNLHLQGTHNGTGGEYAHGISVGGVNGVTISGNLIEDVRGDAVADNAQENDSSAARNVLVKGNTFRHTQRCMVSLVNVADRWAVLDNFCDNTTPRVHPIDLEPWHAASLVTNVEVAYNKIVTPPNQAETDIGNYLGAIAVNAWFDPSPGSNIFVHHNYGSWPFANCVAIINNAGQFTNVLSEYNVQGDTAPGETPPLPGTWRFEVRDGDVLDFDTGNIGPGGEPNQRAEVRYTEGQNTRKGESPYNATPTTGRVVYRFRVKFDTNYPLDQLWATLVQFHPTDENWPVYSGASFPGIAIHGANIDFMKPFTPDSQNIARLPLVVDEWYDFMLDVNWTDSTAGYVRVYRDRALIGEYQGPTITAPYSYLKQGYYRDGSTATTGILFQTPLQLYYPR